MKELTLMKDPERLAREAPSRVFYSLFNDDGSTKQDDYMCWGFISSTDLREVEYIGYKLTEEQYNDVAASAGSTQGCGTTLANRYLKILEEAGVAQWFYRAPKTLEDLNEQYIKISTNYPAPMVVGLLEMYRNVLYYPQWVYYVVSLNRDFGYSAINSILIAKILYLSCGTPSADALSFTPFGDQSFSYFPGVFSVKHILKAVSLLPQGLARESNNFHGVFSFFNLPYSSNSRRSTNASLDIDVPQKYLTYLTSSLGIARNKGNIPRKYLDEINEYLNTAEEKT